MDSRDDTRRRPPLPILFEATFLNSATGPGDTLMVAIEAFGEQPFGDPDGVIWNPVEGAYPQKGDRALVAESDTGDWWVLQWTAS